MFKRLQLHDGNPLPTGQTRWLTAHERSSRCRQILPRRDRKAQRNAACGSEDAAEVQVLRRLLDELLPTSRVGRAFVAAYEATSLPVARFIETREGFKAAVRLLVVRPLARLAAKSVGARKG
jgi:hypothetical protein